MNYILLGLVGFGLIHLFDFISLKRLPYLKSITFSAGSLLWLGSLVLLAASPNRFELPLFVTIAGWSLALVFGLLFIHSLFISLPFSQTYVKKGVGNQLVTTGLYALVRHPGVPMLSLGLIGLALGTGSKELAAAVPIWIIADALLVYLQDRIVFPRMFTGYAEYQCCTPMLLPNKASLTAFIEGLKQNKKVSEV